MPAALHTLPAQNAESKNFNVLIETPKGGRNKFAYDPATELFHEIERFFHSYNEAKGGEFKPVRRARTKQAAKLAAAGQRLAAAHSSTIPA